MEAEKEKKPPVYNEKFTDKRIKEICKGNIVLECQLKNIVDQVRAYERKRRLG